MDRLKGKTILIGKEPGQGRLLVSVMGKTAAIGSPNSVPGSVSRCKVTEGVAHAKIDIDQSGNMVLTNMKSQNVTYVNGSEIASKRIMPSNTVELGKDRFNINLPVVIETAMKIVTVTGGTGGNGGQGGKVGNGGQPISPVQKYNIKHLERVWIHYHDSLKHLREKQKKVNLIRSGCGIFTMCAMPCIFFLGPIGYALTGVGVLGNIYSFVGLKNDNTSDEQERLAEEFQDSYVCPNCGKFLGNISYKMLKKQIVSPKDQKMHCPQGCGAEFIEK